MKLLAYDTSSDLLSVALFDGKKQLAVFRSPLFTRHSSVLVPSIETLLLKAQVKVKQLDYIAMGLGPGSFTGLRVGVTAGKFLSYVTGAKIIGISSLEILAAGTKTADKEIVVMRDAKKGMVYAAIYKKDKQYFVKALVTLKGVKKSLILPFNLAGPFEDRQSHRYVKASGHWIINRKDFNIVWNPVLDKGGIIVGDHITLNWKIKAYTK